MSLLSRMLKTGYGNHPTSYSNCTDKDLYGMFRSEVWSRLNENSRQQLLQETVNRAAAAMGEKGACEVRFDDLPSNIYGRQSGNTITLNREHFVNDVREMSYGGHVISGPFEHSNYMALETVLHENIHAWQNQAIDGTIDIPDKALVDEYRANCFTVSDVVDANGVQRSGSHYLNGMTDDYGYYLYYLQSTERDAHKYSELQTKSIMEQNLSNYGPDPTAETYKKEVEINGYESTLEDAKEAFGNENIEGEINNSLKNHYYGTDLDVDPDVEKIVSNEMAESYDNQMNRNNIEHPEEESEHATEENESAPEESAQTTEGGEGRDQMRGRDPETSYETELTNEPEIGMESAPPAENPDQEAWDDLKNVPFAGDRTENEDAAEDLVTGEESEAPEEALTEESAEDLTTGEETTPEQEEQASDLVASEGTESVNEDPEEETAEDLVTGEESEALEETPAEESTEDLTAGEETTPEQEEQASDFVASEGTQPVNEAPVEEKSEDLAADTKEVPSEAPPEQQDYSEDESYSY